MQKSLTLSSIAHESLQIEHVSGISCIILLFRSFMIGLSFPVGGSTGPGGGRGGFGFE